MVDWVRGFATAADVQLCKDMSEGISDHGGALEFLFSERGWVTKKGGVFDGKGVD